MEWPWATVRKQEALRKQDSLLFVLFCSVCDCFRQAAAPAKKAMAAGAASKPKPRATKELTEEQKQEIREAFDLFDTDSSGWFICWVCVCFFFPALSCSVIKDGRDRTKIAKGRTGHNGMSSWARRAMNGPWHSIWLLNEMRAYNLWRRVEREGILKDKGRGSRERSVDGREKSKELKLHAGNFNIVELESEFCLFFPFCFSL